VWRKGAGNKKKGGGNKIFLFSLKTTLLKEIIK
jgi:hypothetical protein